MIRTQLYLPKPLYNTLRTTAAKEQKSTAQLIRDLLSYALKTKKKANEGKFFLELADKGVRGLDSQGSLKIDEELYGSS